ncbi:Arm DNA-binding domain-containing protein [Pandoraea anhela]|uniref:Prophage integrase IntS n=1 Tax=Pandoraea anhela TaxID=2508295 RepID=A0A5E4U612_9BURK|nr:Arm DNA-binding domain-containing protein [Pandoraea anhela]VVD94334.1 Prophage integrase IntS [Pandoraea anhela]
MPLTDIAVRKATPADKQYRLGDAAGMYLEVQPSGAKYWRLRYRFEGKQKTLALGVYPAVSLRRARESRDAARTLLVKGVDPGASRVAVKANREHLRQTRSRALPESGIVSSRRICRSHMPRATYAV